MRGSIFHPKNLFKHYELIPLVGFVSAVLGMATTYSAYSLYQKPDVRLVKSSELPPFERVDPTKPQKLITLHKEMYKAIPEVEQLRKEIGSYKS